MSIGTVFRRRGRSRCGGAGGTRYGSGEWMRGGCHTGGHRLWDTGRYKGIYHFLYGNGDSVGNGLGHHTRSPVSGDGDEILDPVSSTSDPCGDPVSRDSDP